MTEAAPTLLYLGCAALLIAAVLLPLSAKLRAGVFAAVIIAAVAGGPSPQVAPVTTQNIALSEPRPHAAAIATLRARRSSTSRSPNPASSRISRECSPSRGAGSLTA